MYTCNNLQVRWEYNVQWWLATPVTSSELSRDRCYGRRPLMTTLYKGPLYAAPTSMRASLIKDLPLWEPQGPLSSALHLHSVQGDLLGSQVSHQVHQDPGNFQQAGKRNILCPAVLWWPVGIPPSEKNHEQYISLEVSAVYRQLIISHLSSIFFITRTLVRNWLSQTIHLKLTIS